MKMLFRVHGITERMWGPISAKETVTRRQVENVVVN